MSGQLGKSETDAKEGEMYSDEAVSCDRYADEMMETSENEVQIVDEAVMYVDEGEQCFVEGGVYIIDGVEYVVESVQPAEEEVQQVEEGVQHVQNLVQPLEDEVYCVKEEVQHVKEVHHIKEGVLFGDVKIRNADAEFRYIQEVQCHEEHLNKGNQNVDEASKSSNLGIVDVSAQCLNMDLDDKIYRETQPITKRIHDDTSSIHPPKKRLCDNAKRVDVNNGLQNMNIGIPEVEEAVQNPGSEPEVLDANNELQYMHMRSPDLEKSSQNLNMKKPKINEEDKCWGMENQNIDKTSKHLNLRYSTEKETYQCFNRGIPSVGEDAKNFNQGIVGETTALSLNRGVLDAKKFNTGIVGETTAMNLKRGVLDAKKFNTEIVDETTAMSLNRGVLDAKNFNTEIFGQQYLNIDTKSQTASEIRFSTLHNFNKGIRTSKNITKGCDIAKGTEDVLIKARPCTARRKLQFVEHNYAREMQFVEDQIVEDKVVDTNVEVGIAEVEIGNREDISEDVEKMMDLLNKGSKSAIERTDANTTEVTDAESELEDFLDTITVLFDWDDISQDRVMEIGCGCGHTSVNIVRFFPTLKRLYAVDPSKKEIYLAKSINSHKKIKYKHRNILDTKSFRKYFNKISKVVSINCFQTFRSEKMGFKTIKHILKPGGEAALFFCVESSYFEWIQWIYNLKKWKKFLNETDIIIPRSHILEYDEKYYRNSLEALGFKVIFLRKEEKTHTFKSYAECKEALLYYIFPLTLEMPLEMVDQFEKECFELFLRLNKRNSEDKLCLRYFTLTALFRKPKKSKKKHDKSFIFKL